MDITIKPGKMVAYLNKHLLIKFQETLNTWSYLHYDTASSHQTWQNLNLPWWNSFYRVTWKLDHVVLSDHLTNWNHYLHYHSMYGHQTWQDGNQHWLLLIKSHDPLITCSARSRDKLKSLYVHNHSTYGHQTSQVRNLLLWDLAHKDTWPFDYVILWDHVTT